MYNLNNINYKELRKHKYKYRNFGYYFKEFENFDIIIKNNNIYINYKGLQVNNIIDFVLKNYNNFKTSNIFKNYEYMILWINKETKEILFPKCLFKCKTYYNIFEELTITKNTFNNILLELEFLTGSKF